MTLEQKIGQILMVGFHSLQFDDHVRELLYEHYIGNIILFSRNVADKDQIANLTEEIQKNAIQATGIPAFISIDQEGGMVTRITNGVTVFPGNMAVAATSDPKNAYKIGEIMGKELRALGINMNLSPVLDVNNNPLNPVIGVRSYGENPEKVADFGISYIESLQKNRVIATAKHFPGHGDTRVDSHIDLPIIDHDMKRLQRIELHPFKAAIDIGIDAIMTAHIIFKALDPQTPATLSHNVITGLLRRQLGFKGLVITDCMEMKAIDTYFGTVNAAVMAIKAGADIVLISHTKEKQLGAVKAIKEAVLNGDIPIETIDRAVQRIIDIKYKYNIIDCPYPNRQVIYDTLCSREHISISKAISQKSITVIKDDKSLLPVKTRNILAISPKPTIITGVEDSDRKTQSLAEKLGDKLSCEFSTMDLNPGDDYIERIVQKAKDKELIIVGTYNANLNEGQCKLVNELYKYNENIIVVALRNPYDISAFKQIPTYICTYEYTPLSIDSLINVLVNEVQPLGKAPVTIEAR